MFELSSYAHACRFGLGFNHSAYGRPIGIVRSGSESFRSWRHALSFPADLQRQLFQREARAVCR